MYRTFLLVFLAVGDFVDGAVCAGVDVEPVCGNRTVSLLSGLVVWPGVLRRTFGALTCPACGPWSTCRLP